MKYGGKDLEEYPGFPITFGVTETTLRGILPLLQLIWAIAEQFPSTDLAPEAEVALDRKTSRKYSIPTSGYRGSLAVG